tara:strand:- start:30229 stop:30768 length:540 start_codon:yes stop_codon:yes gene_type:complete
MFCILSITAWLILVATTGISAATAFTVIPKLMPVIPEFQAYDSAQHGRLLAGLTVEPIFRLTDLAQWVLAPASLLLVLVLNALINPPVLLRWISMIAIVIAIAIVVCRWTIIDPPMNRHLDAYREAARTGHLETAVAQLQSFNAWHRIAEPLWGSTGLVLLIGLASVGASIPADRRDFE